MVFLGQMIQMEVSLNTADSPIRIGNRYSDGLYVFKGNIQDYRIYETALNSTQVNEIYNGNHPDDIPNLILNFPANTTIDKAVNNAACDGYPQLVYYGATTMTNSGGLLSDNSLYFSSIYYNTNGWTYDYAETTEDFNLTNKSFTYMLWVNLRYNSSINQILVNQGTSNTLNQNLFCYLNSSEFPAISFWSNDLVSSTALQINRWHHLAFIINDKSGFRGIYLDNKLIASDTNGSALNTANSPIRIGNRRTENAIGFTGHMQDIRLYEKALTEDEIKLIYNSTNSYKDSNSVPFINYKMNEEITDFSSSDANLITWYPLKYFESTIENDIVGDATSETLLQFNGAALELNDNLGLSKYGLYFDGTNNYCTTENTYNFTNSDFSICMWVHRNSAGLQFILHFGSSTNPSQLLAYAVRKY
jgi:hypothetical protein